MILNVLRQVHDQVAAAVTRQYGLTEVPPFAIEVPPNRALGDLAVTIDGREYRGAIEDPPGMPGSRKVDTETRPGPQTVTLPTQPTVGAVEPLVSSQGGGVAVPPANPATVLPVR